MPHMSYTDNNLVVDEGVIRGVEPLLARIRSLGMLPGLSTHCPETITVSDAAGYDVETYIQPLNSIGFLCQVETDWCANVIRGAKHPCVCIKPLGAGRVMPPTGLAFAYENCKPNDTVVIGMLSIQEAEEDIEIARACIEQREAQIALQVTRSKAALVNE